MSEKDVAPRNKGQFPKGVSGNPAGRPKGSKNKVTLMKLVAEETIRTDNAERMLEVANIVIDQALEGDPKAQKLVWDAVMSKGTSDDRTQAKERVEINIGQMAAPPDNPPVDTGVTINQEEIPDG